MTASAAGTLNVLETDGPNNSSGEVDLNGFQLTPQSVPEPASLAMAGFCLVTVLARRKRAR